MTAFWLALIPFLLLTFAMCDVILTRKGHHHDQ